MARNVKEASESLMKANDAELLKIVKHDPDRIRDVAAALQYRLNKDSDKNG